MSAYVSSQKRGTYHESSQSTRLDPTIDVIQNSPGLLLDLDVVNNILPREDGSLSLNDTLVDFAFLAFSDVLGFDGSTRFGIGVLLLLESFGDSTSLED